MQIIKVENLQIFGDNHEPILGPISFNVNAGECVLISGGNGSGKTTLLETIGKLRHSHTGHVQVNTKFTFVNQGINVFTDLTVQENLQLLKPSLKSYNDLLLQIPIIGTLKNKLGGELSGGQKQLVAIARGLLNDSNLFLLDEPFTGLSKVNSEILLDILTKLKQSGKTIMLVEHKNDLVHHLVDQIVYL